MNTGEVNKKIMQMFNLPEMTTKAVILLSPNKPPMVRVTYIEMDGSSITQSTDRFEISNADKQCDSLRSICIEVAKRVSAVAYNEGREGCWSQVNEEAIVDEVLNDRH